jgi:TctA family transporter
MYVIADLLGGFETVLEPQNILYAAIGVLLGRSSACCRASAPR